MTLPKRPNGGELQTTQNPSPTIGQLLCSPKSLEQSYCKYRLAGTRGLHLIHGKQAYMVLPNSWLRSCVLGTIRPSFFLLPLTQVKNWESPSMKKRQVERNGVPYKLVTGRMMRGLQSKSSSVMVLPLGQKMGSEAIGP
jgi:hypothetical protein